jgi:hypothetical protein
VEFFACFREENPQQLGPAGRRPAAPQFVAATPAQTLPLWPGQAATSGG